jgi:Pyruvate/2-oxoacid:ferredoxin oxidoreductase delta subunit
MVAEGRAPALKGLVAVIGSGYAAIDAARCVVRLGANALLVYRRRREDRPAFRDEIRMALEEGVEIKYFEAPLSIEAEGEEYLLRLESISSPGEAGLTGEAGAGPGHGKAETIRVSRIFKAAGLEAADSWMDSSRNGAETIRLNNTVLHRTDRGLPVVSGNPASASKGVVHAIACGKEAAIALDALFREGPEAVRPALDRCKAGGRSLSMEIYMGGLRLQRSPAVVRYNELNTDYFHFSPRIAIPRLPEGERSKSFAEVDLDISANLAIREAERCFNCGICNQCGNCYLFCPDLSVSLSKERTEPSIDYDYCKGCGICIKECPRGVISVGEEAR